ncbi:MAG: alpha-L-arabinofuranosidase C-terminal domain-containing protein [Candidatus Brocadiia bacterium]
MPSEVELLRHIETEDPTQAELRIDPDTRASHAVSPLLYGKFCEHLGSNIYNGMHAQILRNPTFARWFFADGTDFANGGRLPEGDDTRRRQAARRQFERAGWPEPDAPYESYLDGCAFGWVRLGASDDMRLSPDVDPVGVRAQRVEVMKGRGGMAQWVHLPLHRTRTFEYRLVARGIDEATVRLSISPKTDGPEAGPELSGADLSLDADWSTLAGTLTLPGDTGAPEDGLYRVALTAESPAHLVVARLLLYPDDHIEGADPDVIRMLTESGLPLLRWPGGNFVSGYRWRLGVGPVDERPSVPNTAWGGLEYNLFGTDEFIAFCRAVGCEPMICVNAGDGSAEEAARWVEYCNGDTSTPMGALREDNGHPEPYGVHYWEIGNETWYRHQESWTTPAGNLDRYRRFREAMLAVDPTIEVQACGDPLAGADSEWNRALIENASDELEVITDHILTGGSVGDHTDPVELFHSFMGVPSQLRRIYSDLEQKMLSAGVENPRLAVTELQLFAHFDDRPGEGPPWGRGSLTPDTMPRPDTISEALYDAGIIHEFMRMGDFVEMLTHSATVNHGGGLRKRKERVWANPCHYAHTMGLALAGGTPVGLTLKCGTYSTDRSFDPNVMPPLSGMPVIDAMAVVKEGGHRLVIMLVHRCATCGAIDLTINLDGFANAAKAQVTSLSGESMHDRNTYEEPERIVPEETTYQVKGGILELALPAYSLTRVTVAAESG